MRFIFLLLIIPYIVKAQHFQVNEKNSIDSIIQYSGDKIILLDFYTEWCGPCKRMDKEVLVDTTISRLINTNFILLKVDAEKGYGIFLSKKYNVTSYPTYVFLNSNATPIYKTNGFISPNKFLTQLGYAISESREKTTIDKLDSLYFYNQYNTSFLYEYLCRRTRLRLDNSDLLDRYIALLPGIEKNRNENLQLIINNGDRISKSLQIGPSLELLVSNSDKLKDFEGAFGIDFYIDNAKQKTLKKSIEFKSDSLLNIVIKNTKAGDIFDNEYTIKLEYFSNLNDIKSYLKCVNEFFDSSLAKYTINKMAIMDSIVYAKILSSDDFKNAPEEEQKEVRSEYKRTQSVRFIRLYNSINDYLVKNLIDKNDLSKIKKWAQFSLQICKVDTLYFRFLYPHSLNTYAVILYKIGQKKDAISHLKQAILFGSKVESDDVKVYKSQLNKMLSNKSILSW
jgi:thioredoxin-related protein